MDKILKTASVKMGDKIIEVVFDWFVQDTEDRSIVLYRNDCIVANLSKESVYVISGVEKEYKPINQSAGSAKGDKTHL